MSPIDWGIMGENSVANAGYSITGSGGGGAGGRYLVADPDELQDLIAEWEALRDRIFVRGRELQRAEGIISSPAEDPLSSEHARVLRLSLRNAWEHSDAMRAYADDYITKLNLSRSQYLTTEGANAQRLYAVGEG